MHANYGYSFGVAFGAAFLILAVLWLVGIVYWIVKIIEVARLPEHQFRVAGTDKTVWVLVVVLAGFVGALVWQFAKRRDVLASAGLMPQLPPGWYPETGTGMLRWWDGYRWTEHRHTPGPPPR